MLVNEMLTNLNYLIYNNFVLRINRRRPNFAVTPSPAKSYCKWSKHCR